MQLRRNKEMEFETLKKSYKKQIIIGALAICIIGGALTFNLTRAKYKITGSIPLVKGNVNYQVPDMRVVAINVSEDGTNYNLADEVPTGEYTLNTDKTICKVATETSGIENAPKDNNITIEYKEGKINFLGISKRNTRCYLYFDKVLDIEKPIISDVTTSVTKTEINVTVTASDNKGVTEYWYQLGSNAAMKGTGNTYKFTGLTAGTTYEVKVYIKDAAGNTSDIAIESVATLPDDVTILSRTQSYFTLDLSYSTDSGNSWTTINSNVESITIPIGTIIKSNKYNDGLYFCSKDVTSCYSSIDGYLGAATNTKYYTITGNEAVFTYYYCLAEDTLIAMYDEKKKRKRNKKIKDIKVGDRIYTYNNKTKRLGLATVKKIEVIKNNLIYAITLKNGEIIRCSKEHGFYIENREFMMAYELTKGLKIMSMDGNNYEIVDIKIEKYVKGIDLYNILVDDGNSIFITSLKVMSYVTTFMVGYNLTTKRDVVLGTT